MTKSVPQKLLSVTVLKVQRTEIFEIGIHHVKIHSIRGQGNENNEKFWVAAQAIL